MFLNRDWIEPRSSQHILKSNYLWKKNNKKSLYFSKSNLTILMVLSYAEAWNQRMWRGPSLRRSAYRQHTFESEETLQGWQAVSNRSPVHLSSLSGSKSSRTFCITIQCWRHNHLFYLWHQQINYESKYWYIFKLNMCINIPDLIGQRVEP